MTNLKTYIIDTPRYCMNHKTVEAYADAPIPGTNGMWADICKDCYDAYDCNTGTLLVIGNPDDNIYEDEPELDEEQIAFFEEVMSRLHKR